MEQITVNLLATGETPVCHASQFDDGRTIRINLKKGADVYTLSGTEEVKMRIRKPDNTERVVDIVNTSSSYVDYVSTPEDCDISGVNVCELVIDDLGSKNFNMKVEEDAYGGGADIETLTASGSVATFETNIVDNLVDLKANIEPIQDLHGYDYPWSAGGGKNKCSMPNTTFEQFAEVEIDEIPAGSYAYSAVITSTDTDSDTCAIIFLDAEKNTLTSKSLNRSVGTSRISTTFTVSTPIKYLRLYAASGYPSGAGDTASFVDNMICLQSASNPTVFEPYENICPITGHTEAKIVHAGKNLLPNKKRQRSNYSVNIGTDNVNNPVFLKAGTYTLNVTANISGLTAFCSGNNTPQKNIASSFPKTFTIDKDDYFLFWVYKNGEITVDDIVSFQLELGSVSTDYEAFTGTEVTVQFGQTIYKGVLDAKNSKVILTSKSMKIQDRTWIYLSQYSYFQNTVSDIKRNASATAVLEGLMCEAYANRTQQQAGSGNRNGSIAGLNDAIRIKDLAYDNPTDFVNAMGDYLIVYPLAEPIEIPLSAISQFETLLGVNNVYANTGDVELKYLKQM